MRVLTHWFVTQPFFSCERICVTIQVNSEGEGRELQDKSDGEERSISWDMKLAITVLFFLFWEKSCVRPPCAKGGRFPFEVWPLLAVRGSGERGWVAVVWQQLCLYLGLKKGEIILCRGSNGGVSIIWLSIYDIHSFLISWLWCSTLGNGTILEEHACTSILLNSLIAYLTLLIITIVIVIFGTTGPCWFTGCRWLSHPRHLRKKKN